MAIIGSEKSRAQKAALSKMIIGKEKETEGWQPPAGIKQNPEPIKFKQPQSNILRSSRSNILRNSSLGNTADKKKEKNDLRLSSPTFPIRIGY